MKDKMKIWQCAVVLIGLMVTIASADNNGHRNEIAERIVAPGQEFFGKSYNELASEWTNWLVAEPVASNPALDPDGQFCDKNQKGKVWFLASTFEGVTDRTCKIPADKAIFIGFGGAYVSFPPEFPTEGSPCLALATDVEKVRCDVKGDIPTAPDTSFEIFIDDEPVEDPFAFRAQSQPGGFTLRIPEPSLITEVYELPSGDRFPAVADGYFLFLKPLHPGEHTLKILMTSPSTDPESETGVFEAGVNYKLIITGKKD